MNIITSLKKWVATKVNSSHENITLKFVKDNYGWYADVAGHSRGQNAMVAGADKFLDALLADGQNTITIEFASDIKWPKDKEYLFRLKRLIHDPFGATYKIISGKGKFPVPMMWLCNVTHDVTGEHPKSIWVKSIVCGHQDIPQPVQTQQRGEFEPPVMIGGGDTLRRWRVGSIGDGFDEELDLPF